MFTSNTIYVEIVVPFRCCRFGDISSGHYDWPPRPNDQGSPNVFVNNKPWHRAGDHWEIHCNPEGQCHDGFLVHGAPAVYVNNIPAGRIGDLISCGAHNEFADDGSPNTFCGNFRGPGASVGFNSPNFSEKEWTHSGEEQEDSFDTPNPAGGGDTEHVSRPDYQSWERSPFPWDKVDRQIHQY
jgi:uncharacterized Zn-binding protein involved in type VI secretion